ncbi:MAG: hypothetical protein WA532_07805 [Candidatus Korobacteraceae bacterium]
MKVSARQSPEEQSRRGKATAIVKNAAEACYLCGKLLARRDFNTLPGMSRVSLRTAIVASRPIARNSAKKITATIRTGINHPGGIVRRRHRCFGDRRHLAR